MLSALDPGAALLLLPQGHPGAGLQPTPRVLQPHPADGGGPTRRRRGPKHGENEVNEGSPLVAPLNLAQTGAAGRPAS